ncbi:hypothetical protein NUU61_000187 [Penicillium alfredii]|uniref:DUF2415 domain-containing protein n=1 Tax=Penicillium alfredii TaxID=1506179 RepID=A0A9W9G991_9EURO|nr:uncharacterized protein NUU61_000187 [Penicillium alfredii]KAJ5114428.1 hypothetical protein NUU61_000187 [Penicillium alfredii]
MLKIPWRLRGDSSRVSLMRPSHHVSCDPGPSAPVMDNTSPGAPRSRSASQQQQHAPAVSSSAHAFSGSGSPSATMSVSAADDHRLHDVGLAALAAVSQYPHAVDPERDSFLVSEVVHAVTGSSPLPRHSRSHPRESVTYSPSSATAMPYPAGLAGRYPDPFEARDVSQESETTDGDVSMESFTQELFRRRAPLQNIATIVDDTDHGNDRRDLLMDYDSTMAEDRPSPSPSRDDEVQDLIRFYPDEEYYYYQRKAQRSPHDPATDDVNLDDFYQGFNYDVSDVDLPPAPAAPVPDPFESDEMLDQPEFPPPHPASSIHTTTYERNLTIDEFIERWMMQLNATSYNFETETRIHPQLRPLAKMIGWQPPQEVIRPHAYQREFYDLQRIPWRDTLRVRRSDARALRDAWYTSYHNLDYSHISHAKRLPQRDACFREKSMHTSHKANVEHFQLRNLMSVPAYDTVHFATRSKIFSWEPTYDDNANCLIDMTQPDPEAGFLGPVKISTMKTAHGLTIAGGFCGEYALRAMRSEGSGSKGLVTPDFNDGITNHVDIVRSRTGASPMGIFASNDKHLRMLDCETNIFVSDQELSRPLNCTATSPDSRLRVVIGDSPDAWVIEADTGRPVHPLRGHRDFGFACAWSPDMRHIATSNQDKTVIIWDARTWRALETIDSDVAGYRSLRFSPVGGGPRTLLCTEPADRIAIVDAQLYQSRQVHDFFGEVGGADYDPDGSVIWVANTDPHFGGFMQYERRQWGQRFALSGFPNEWVPEAELDGDERCVLGAGEREMRFLRNLSDEEHEALIL